MRLVVFDVDGTLVDSQHHIHASMAAAFGAIGLATPTLAEVHAVVGLSLPRAIMHIRPELSETQLRAAVAAYRIHFHDAHDAHGEMEAPLFPGARHCLEKLAARDDLLLAVATGKGRRGLDALMAQHDLTGFFTAMECADRHPSKPHPAMLEAVCNGLGIAPDAAVMIGDTSFDMEMARSVGVTPLGVAWGYHAPERLEASGAVWVARDFDALTGWIKDWAA